jgi:hypothetical protein
VDGEGLAPAGCGGGGGVAAIYGGGGLVADGVAPPQRPPLPWVPGAVQGQSFASNPFAQAIPEKK